MHTQRFEHNAAPADETVRVTLVMTTELKNRLQSLAATDHRSLSNQCVVLIERSLAELSIAA